MIAGSPEPKNFWPQMLKGLEPNHAEVPFALLYSAGGNTNEALSVSREQSEGLCNWVLEGTVRVGEQSSSIPTRLSSAHALEEFIPNFLEMIKSDTPTQLQAKDGTVPPAIVQALREHDDEESCDNAIFLPIRSTSDKVLGFLIIGVNSKKRYDDDYRLFLEMLSRQLATSLASAVLFEEETRRSNAAIELATEHRNLLAKQLAFQTHEALEFESRFRRMADMAPVGMFHYKPNGQIVYANEHWYGLTGHGRDLSVPMVCLHQPSRLILTN